MLLLYQSADTLRELLVGSENGFGRTEVRAITHNVFGFDEPRQSCINLVVIQDGVLNTISDGDDVAQSRSTGLTTRIR